VTKLYGPELENMRRELMRFRFDAQYRGYDRRVPVAGLAAYCGVTRQTIYALTARRIEFSLKPATHARLAHVIAMVLEKGLRWRRRDRRWEPFLPGGAPLPQRPMKEDKWSRGHTVA
jgi:hypothetical protein